MRRPKRWWLTALLAAGLALLSGCDVDGDGYDDQTGEPVAQVGDQTEIRSSGCAPGGVPWLQPDHCNPDVATEQLVATNIGQLSTIARHEAGHKRCAEYYGWNVTSTTLDRDWSDNGPDDMVGRTNVWGLRWKDPQLRLVFLYCGAAAAGTDQGADRDLEAAVQVLADCTDCDESAARAEAQRITDEGVAQIDQDTVDLLANGRI